MNITNPSNVEKGSKIIARPHTASTPATRQESHQRP